MLPDLCTEWTNCFVISKKYLQNSRHAGMFTPTWFHQTDWTGQQKWLFFFLRQLIAFLWGVSMRKSVQWGPWGFEVWELPGMEDTPRLYGTTDSVLSMLLNRSPCEHQTKSNWLASICLLAKVTHFGLFGIIKFYFCAIVYMTSTYFLLFGLKSQTSTLLKCRNRTVEMAQQWTAMLQRTLGQFPAPTQGPTTASYPSLEPASCRVHKCTWAHT